MWDIFLYIFVFFEYLIDVISLAEMAKQIICTKCIQWYTYSKVWSFIKAHLGVESLCLCVVIDCKLWICSTDEGFNQFPSFIQKTAITNQSYKYKMGQNLLWNIGGFFSRNVQKMGIKRFKEEKGQTFIF